MDEHLDNAKEQYYEYKNADKSSVIGFLNSLGIKANDLGDEGLDDKIFSLGIKKRNEIPYPRLQFNNSPEDEQKYQQEKQLYDKSRIIIKKLMDISNMVYIHNSQKKDPSTSYIEKTLNYNNKMMQEIQSNSLINSEKLKQKINEIVGMFPIWNTRYIQISGEDSYDEYGKDISISPITSFSVTMASVLENEEESMAPHFSVFEDGDKYIIDDIIEAGDNDFFTENGIQTDYFNLINGLKGNIKKEVQRNLTLYTGRPAKDRQQLDSLNNQFPVNIFLTSNYNFAENFGRDYNEERDVWKVVINSKYLINTLDGGSDKQYQTFSPDGGSYVPVIRKELVYVSNESQ